MRATRSGGKAGISTGMIGATAIVVLVLMGTGLAVHTDDPPGFEIDDENGAYDGVGNEDWEQIFNGASAATAQTFIREGASDFEGKDGDTTYFTGGGSKDIHDLDQWSAAGNSVPPKDDIQNAAAGFFETENGRFLFFMLDLYRTNGDAAAGFWFLKGFAEIAPNGSFMGADGKLAQHQEGDLLVLSEFSNGGTVPEIRVLEWSGGALVPLVDFGPGDICVPNGNICAVVNSEPGNTPPWPYSGVPAKGHADGTHDATAFFEGGLDWDHFFGRGEACFNTFIAQTRSSTSTTSVLKDVALGRFNNCDANIRIDPGYAENPVRTTHTFTTTVGRDVGQGFVPAAGIEVTLDIWSGPGQWYDPDTDIWLGATTTCTTNATGQCDAIARSDVKGLMQVNATATLQLGPKAVEVTTNGADGNSGPAQKLWFPVDGTIRIEKIADPRDGTDFWFDASWMGDGPGADFALDDDDDDGLPDNRTFVLHHGQYAVTELGIQDWRLTGLSCSEDVEEGSGADGSTAYIDLQPEETVTCTFTNTKDATLILEKQTLPDGAQQTFQFVGGVAGSIQDDDNITVVAPPGRYDSIELVPAGWRLTDVRCDDDDSSGHLPTNTVTFNASAGERITCVATNTQDASITVHKIAIGGEGEFTFEGALEGTIPGGGSLSSPVIPGQSYKVNETGLPAHWHLTGIACDDGVEVDAPTHTVWFSPGPGEHQACTFTNTRNGTVTIVKQAFPADGQDFDFAASWLDGGFLLDVDDDDALPSSRTFSLVPGQYSVQETPIPDFWGLIDLWCDDGEGESPSTVQGATANIDLDAGEHVTCTFDNIRSVDTTIRTTPMHGEGETRGITFGETIRDLASVIGDDGQAPPGGNVTFWICAPSEVAPNGDGDPHCPDGAGTQIAKVDLLGGTAMTPEFAPDHAGTWCWRAAYSGTEDGVYGPSDEQSTTECFDVAKATPELDTVPSSGEIVLGATVVDHATINGVGGDFPAPTGSITFYVCNGTEVDSTGRCAGGTSLGPSSIVGGQAVSAPVTPDAPGTWCFRAEYPGDGNYEAVQHNATTECFVVLDVPDLTLEKWHDGGDKVPSGTPLTYTIRYENIGGSEALAVVITDPLPAGTTLVSCTDDCAGPDAKGNVTWSVGTVKAGANGTVNMTVTVAPEDGRCQICNRAFGAYFDRNTAPPEPEEPTDDVQEVPPETPELTDEEGDEGPDPYFVASNEVCFCVGYAATTQGARAAGTATPLSVQAPAFGIDETPVHAASARNFAGMSQDDDIGSDEGVAVPSTAGVRVQWLDADSTSKVSKMGADQRSRSQAAAVDIDIGGVLAIQADVVEAIAQTHADGADATYSADGSRIEGLTINGVPYTHVNPDTVIPLDPLVFGAGSHISLFVRDGAVSLPPGDSGGQYLADLEVRMIEVHIEDLSGQGVGPIHIVVGAADAQSRFTQTPVCEILHDQAVAAYADVGVVATQEQASPIVTAADGVDGAVRHMHTHIEPNGGHDHAWADISTPTVYQAGGLEVFSAEAVQSQSSGARVHGASTSHSYAEAGRVCLLEQAGVCAVEAIGVRAEAWAHAGPGGATATGEVRLAGLAVRGVTMDLCGDAGFGNGCTPPHSEIPVPGIGVLHINEQFPTAAPGEAGILVRALWLQLDPGAPVTGELIAVQAHAWARWVHDDTPLDLPCVECDDAPGQGATATADAVRAEFDGILPPELLYTEISATEAGPGTTDHQHIFEQTAGFPVTGDHVASVAGGHATSSTRFEGGKTVAEADALVSGVCLLDDGTTCLVSAGIVDVRSRSVAWKTGASSTGSVTISALAIDGITSDLCQDLGMATTCTPPHTHVPIPGVGTLHVNHVTNANADRCSGLLVRGLWLEADVAGLGAVLTDVVVGEAYTAACFERGEECVQTVAPIPPPEPRPQGLGEVPGLGEPNPLVPDELEPDLPNWLPGQEMPPQQVTRLLNIIDRQLGIAGLPNPLAPVTA